MRLKLTDARFAIVKAKVRQRNTKRTSTHMPCSLCNKFPIDANSMLRHRFWKCIYLQNVGPTQMPNCLPIFAKITTRFEKIAPACP